MKNAFVFSTFILFAIMFTNCSDDDTYNVIQVGNWKGVGVAELFLDSLSYSKDTFYFDIVLRNNKTGMIINEQSNIQELIDWQVENDTITMVEEKLNVAGDKFQNEIQYIIKESSLEYQEWYTFYRIKPGGNIWYDGKSTRYLTRIE